MKIYLYLAGFIACLALLGGTFAYGYHKGSLSELTKIAEKTAQKQEELYDLNEIIRKQTEALRQKNRENEELINELEQAAVVAPGSNGPGVSTTGGLLRLERRWATSPATPD